MAEYTPDANFVPGARTLANATAITGAVTTTFLPLNLSDVQGAAFFQISWTGTLTAVALGIKVQGSVDGTVWSDLATQPSWVLPAGVAGFTHGDVVQTGSPLLRISYQNASGTGTMTVVAFEKSV